MAVVNTSAMYTRIREVLQSAAGTLRTITADTYSGDLPENLTDQTQARKSVDRPRIEPRITRWARSASGYPVIGNLAVYDLELRVRVVRTVDRTAQIDFDARDAAKALAADDCDRLAQALGFPGNLSTTAAGTATGIVSGLLTYRESISDVRGPVDDGVSMIETDHRFTGIVTSTPAVS